MAISERLGALEANAEQQVILGCLLRVRRRLWLVRMAERATMGLGWGAAIALFTTGAWLLRVRFPWLAGVVAVAPLSGAAWLWMRGSRRSDEGLLTGRLMRVGALLTGLMAVAMLTLIVLSPLGSVAPTWSISAATIALFMFAGAASVHPVDPRTAAIFIDQRVGLRERVSTAVELLNTPPTSPLERAFRQPVVDAAINACATVRSARVGYGRLDQRIYAMAAVAIIAALGISWLTPLPAYARPTSRQYPLIVEKASRMAEVLKQLEQKELPNDPQAAGKLDPLKNALSELKKGDMSPFEAQALIQDAQAQIKKDLDATAAANQAKAELDKLKGLEAMASAMRGDTPQPGDSAKNDGSGNVSAAATQSADKVGGMSESEKASLAAGLKAAAAKAEGDPQLQKDLANAADAVSKGDGKAMSQNLEAAGNRIAQSGGAGSSGGLSSDAVRRAMDDIQRIANDSGDGAGGAGDQQGGGSDKQGGSQQGGGQQGGGQQSEGAQGSQPGGGQDGQQGRGGQQGARGAQGQGAQGAQGADGASGQGKDGEKGGDNGKGRGPENGNGNGGSTNFYNPSGPGNHDVGSEIGRVGTFVKLYDPKEITSQGQELRVQSKINPLGGPAVGSAEVLGAGDPSSATIKTYESQLNTARQRAMDDLSTQTIPPQYQELIKAYYGK